MSKKSLHRARLVAGAMAIFLGGVASAQVLPTAAPRPQWRCGTHFDRAHLRADQGRLLQQVRSRPVLSGTPETMDSANGRFRFHFTRTGVDAVAAKDEDPANGIPDYVDDMIDGVTRAHHAWVVEGGWADPPPDQGGGGGDDRIDFYIKRITCEEASGVTSCGPGGQPPSFLFGITRSETRLTDPGRSRWTSYVLLNPANDIPLGRNFAKSVAAHEYHHVIQFGMDTGEPNWVYESTAAYLQLVLFKILEETPYVVDALLFSRLEQPHLSLYTREGRMEYSNALWFRFLVDRYGDPGIVRALWDRMSQSSTSSLYDALDTEIMARGGGFFPAFLEWGEWNYFLCGRDDGRHYRSGALCVSNSTSVRLGATHNQYPVVDQTPSLLPQPLGVTYLQFHPDGRGRDLIVDVAGDPAVSWAARLMKVGRDCTTTAEEVTVASDGRATVQIPSVHAYQAVTLMVANGNRTGSTAGNLTYSARVEGGYTGPAPSPTVTQTSLNVEPATVTFTGPGESGSLIALARYDDCTSRNATRSASAEWRSRDPAIAEVTSSGIVTARGPGQTVVTVSFGGQQSTSTITVGTIEPPQPPAKSGGCTESGMRGTAGGSLLGMVLVALLALRRRRQAVVREK